MSLLQSTIAKIEAKSPEFEKKAKAHIEQLTMPHWALGRLLDLAQELAAMTRSMHPPVSRKVIFVMAADHGIAEAGVSLYPKEVTAQMVHNFAAGGASINALSRQIGARTVVVDMGVDGDLSPLVKAGQVVDAKVRKGTRNFAKEAAMTQAEALQALEAGIQLANDYATEFDLFGTGDMGIANTTSSAAIASLLCDCPVETVVGRGTGINDQQLAHKTRVIEAALSLHKPNPKDALDILQKVGGYEIAAIAGLILGAASLRKPILVDGYISTAAALIAHALCPHAMDYAIASHASAERGQKIMWDKLGRKPLLDLDMRLGEGTGGALAMHLVESSVRILTEVATFSSASVSKKIEE